MKLVPLPLFLSLCGLLISISPIKNADAALAIYCAAPSYVPAGYAVPTLIGGFLAQGAVAYAIMVISPTSPLGQLAAIGIYMLDADGSLPQSKLQEEFAIRYPYIDNADVIANLSSAVKKKYDESKAIDGSTVVRLDEQEIRSILNSADLTDEQIKKVTLDLNGSSVF